MNKFTLLAWVLRLNAIVLMMALIPVLFPYSLMNSIHQWLGLGELPNTSITEYLTRSLSLVYALHGTVCLTLAMDVRKYLPLIQLIAIYHFVFGLIMLAIDLKSGLPWYWIIGEGPMIAAFAVFVFFFCKICRQELDQEKDE